MSTESIGNLDLPVGHPNHQESEQSVAEILLVDSNEVTPEEAMFWRDAGLIFLKNLSKESFRLRFGSPKPEEDTGLIPVVDYFVFSQQHHHKMLLLLHEAKLIGACSIFDYPLRDSMGSSTVINTDDVVELAVTISDEQQGKKLGTVLLEQAVQVAGADGKTHVYTSFNSDNDRSRRLVERILGSANIVAGKDNLQDKFWRIPGVPADDYMIQKTLCVSIVVMNLQSLMILSEGIGLIVLVSLVAIFYRRFRYHTIPKALIHQSKHFLKY